MRFIFFVLLFFLSFTFALALEKGDSFLIVPKSGFLKDFMSRQGFMYPAQGGANTFLRIEDLLYATKPQILLKNGLSFSIAIGSSGRIYECTGENDSSYFLKRLDKTINHNYNIGAYYFYFKGDLYCFAGYGFWKNNGILKVFNRKDGEWDFIAMENEIIPQVFNIGNSWFDQEQKRLYVPFQSKVNAGITGEENIKGIVDPNSFVMDLNTYKWEKLGEASKMVIDLFRNGSSVVNTTQGLLVNEAHDLYWVDFKKNQISISTKTSLNQTFIRAQQRGFLYQHHDHIYFYNPSNGTTDSIGLSLKDFRPLPTPIWGGKKAMPLWIGFGLSPIIFLLFLSWYNRKEKKNYVQDSDSSNMNFQISFTDTEKALLNLLLDKTLLDKKASVADVNYVLGLKNKKTGLQKKVRSDVFNSIHEKYTYLFQSNSPLILTIRSEEDKRFFEFCLSQEGVDQIQSYLK